MHSFLPKFNSEYFKKIYWLPPSSRIEYYIANSIFKYWNGILPGYINELFKLLLCRYNKITDGIRRTPAEKC